MIAWRITQKRFADPPLNGLGGLFASGRWHSRGQQVIYMAESQSLAILESLVHYDPANAPIEQVIISADIAAVSLLTAADIGLDNNDIRGMHVYDLRALGDNWLKQKTSCVLKVPSIIMPFDEYNYLINPLHQDFAKIKKIKLTDFRFDKRLLRS
ncbi:RES family NAD+ phosphorylase [Cysteiniphilum sp. QT6929]|uniref:RES family NAD+ phosphorylase n=1 Tax=Cysteiniphilum sp. QT6929 TaxID=2975055 RepID=UPI0024B363A2|nr:RES family NAD+ phosphorylase [Cysteiniphilum sp. QT6929]WHN64547.1 RES family NAD+ phosphorylase [Cysteiniphilum sp. QT6929]